MARLEIELDAESRRKVLASACHPVLRARHVTLAFGVERRDFLPEWVPGGAEVGALVALSAVARLQNECVQALVVEIAGSTLRPHDQGTLHVTVSRTEAGRSKDSNALLASGERKAITLQLTGTVVWVD